MNAFSVIPIALAVLASIWWFIAAREGNRTVWVCICSAILGPVIFLFGTGLVTKYVIPRRWWFEVVGDWKIIVPVMFTVWVLVMGFGFLLKRSD